MQNYQLTDREKTILRSVIYQYILTANPVGSRNLAKKYDVGFSPATIRNIMSDLELEGYLHHPHTSAGRIPTDKGYRFYVDSLEPSAEMISGVKKRIKAELEAESTDDLLQLTSLILSQITHQLACVTYPKFDNAILQKIQLVKLSAKRLMVVLSIKSGLVRTITLEIKTKHNSDDFNNIQKVLNERLSGLSFTEIRKSFKDRLQGFYKEDLKPIIRFFLESTDKIFSDLKTHNKTFISGTKNILEHPEFENHNNFQSIIELVEDHEVIIHVMDKQLSDKRVVAINIGSEAEDDRLVNYTTISKKYKLGEINGTVGIIGPKRMEYSRTIAAVEFIAELLSKELKKINT